MPGRKTGKHAPAASHPTELSSPTSAGRLAAALPEPFIGGWGVAVGVDLIEVERVAQSVERFGARFLHRVFTEEELEESRRRITWLAGRFAAKEACAKALGTGIGASVSWHDMQILRQPSGKPALRLLGDAAKLAAALGIAHLDVSISHTRQYAMAVVVALTGAVGGREQPTAAI